MKIHYIFVVLCAHLYLSDAKVFYPECVPSCGEAFLATKEDPLYYENKVEDTYEANKGKSSKILYQAVKGTLMPNQEELGKNSGYFEHCISVKGDLNTKRGLEKYGKCRLLLTPGMTLVASKEVAESLPDSPKGLADAHAVIKKKFKNAKEVESFKKCARA